MNKTRKLQLRERKRRQKIKNNLVWGGIGLAVISAIGLVIWQGVRPGVGETVAIPTNYAQHV
ncbi:MAG: hypothetical protein V2I50_14540, partial [Desulfuromusa sp.]|nr:hypothetical protein [Desulfuromusa sp.]